MFITVIAHATLLKEIVGSFLDIFMLIFPWVNTVRALKEKPHIC